MTKVNTSYQCSKCFFLHESLQPIVRIGEIHNCPKCHHPNTFVQVTEEVREQAEINRTQVKELDSSAQQIDRIDNTSQAVGELQDQEEKSKIQINSEDNSARKVKYNSNKTKSSSYKKQYSSLISQYSGQDKSTVFAHFPFGGRQGTQWYQHFKDLSDLAKEEVWGFQRSEFKTRDNNPIPILVNYLKYTFIRLQQESKIIFIDERACFNTGLQTPNEQDIFAVFSKNRHQQESREDWYFNGWKDSYDLKGFNPLPEIASYITDASDLVFDISYKIDVNLDHILDDQDNKNRLPEIFRNNKTVALNAIKGATEHLKQKCIRNYKTAIPFWYNASGKIQLLLPLYLTNAERADLALVADKDKDDKVYRIKTALTMDMAYTNARLITRPDRDWLNP